MAGRVLPGKRKTTEMTECSFCLAGRVQWCGACTELRVPPSRLVDSCLGCFFDVAVALASVVQRC